jgi:hypothetical protein
MWQGHGAGALHSHDRMDALRAARVAGAGGLGMPPPEKFRSGHLPRSSVPLRPTSASSASDMDESSDADEDVEVLSGGAGGRYSVDSSPRLDDHLPRRAAVPLYRYANNVPGHQSSYYSSDGYSDLSSSRDTALPRGAKPRPAQQQQARAAAAYVEEEEYSDSAGSSEFSSHAGRRSNGVASKGGYASEYSHTGPARREAGNAVPNPRAAASKPSNSRNHQQERYSAHVPARDNANPSPKMVCFPC